MADPVVSTQWLAERLEDPDLRICDVRWYLPNSGRRGIEEFRAGHLPGAVFVDLDRDLAAPDDGRAGRHPLPEPAAFETAMRRAGISRRSRVVAYDDAGGSTAARLWWLLRAHGHAEAYVLDGGLQAWRREGRPLSTGDERLAPGDFVSRWNPATAVDLEELRRALREGALLLDARAAERYRGEVEPVDPRAGHVPGAVSAPFSASLGPEGTFLPPEELRRRFSALGAGQRPVLVSCGSGVTACHLLLGLERAGLARVGEARVYAGSFSEWARRPELPVATGDAPGRPV